MEPSRSRINSAEVSSLIVDNYSMQDILSYYIDKIDKIASASLVQAREGKVEASMIELGRLQEVLPTIRGIINNVDNRRSIDEVKENQKKA